MIDKSNENDENNKILIDTVKNEKHNVKKDTKNVILLMFLYTLQTVPLGLTGSLPYILSSRKVSYGDQGTFSFAFWPFSLKLLWAPIVDSIFFKNFGRRKSWLIPLQFLIGFYLIGFSSYIKQLLDIEKYEQIDDNNNNIKILTLIFFSFTLLAATHDIVVDGWALTMLSQ
jgi:PAT family acetyl-CoA transporter-like MFS transporter 1